MINLSKIYIDTNDSYSRLCCPITISNTDIDDVIWFEVSSEYSKYLCFERSDAFIVSLLNYAMMNNHDIFFETPISEDLYFNITEFLLPTLCKSGKKFHSISLIGEIENTCMISEHAVGTGISSGVDSLEVIATYSSISNEGYKITHLAFNNVGSHGEGDRAMNLSQLRREHAKRFCAEFGFPFVSTNSNIQDIVQQNHYLTHTYTSCFAVLCLQKLYSKYYYASSVSIFNFSLEDSDVKSPGHYESLLLNCFSINNIRFFSTGMTLSRLDKTSIVSNYSPSYKFLNVCTSTADNCGHCEKCMRTLLTLEALNKIDLYDTVFDIKKYKSTPYRNKVFLCQQILKGKDDYIPLKHYFKINFIHYIMAFVQNTVINTYIFIRPYLSDKFVDYMKKTLK